MKKLIVPELLSPAGNRQSVITAINNGCNCVYLGGKKFNARTSSDGFEVDDILWAIDYAHLRGVKIYITLNILYKDFEISDVLDFVKIFYYAGADAFIVQDIGISMLLLKNFENINLHASTQMNIHSAEGVNFLEDLGFRRVILSRELNIDQIEYISKNTNLELEIFVHGAMCISYSGLCTMSSMIGSRSGNRGKCAQSCRLPYTLYENGYMLKEGFLLSPKDMMTLDCLDKLLKLNICAFKIEGRMKSPEYVAIVTNSYRNHIDKFFENNDEYKVDTQQLKNLTQIFNRGGDFHTGYLEGHSTFDMMSIKTPKKTGILVGIVQAYENEICCFEAYEDLFCADGIEIVTKKQPSVGTNLNKIIKKGQIAKISIKGEIAPGDFVYKNFDKKLDDDLKKEATKDVKKINVYAKVKIIQGQKMFILLKYKNIEIKLESDVVQSAINNPISCDDVLKQLKKTGNTSFNIIFEEVIVGPDCYVTVRTLNDFRRNALDILSKKILESYKKPEFDFKYQNYIEPEIVYEKKLTILARTKEIFDVVSNFDVDSIYLEYSCIFKYSIKYFLDKCNDRNIKLYLALDIVTKSQDMILIRELLEKLEDTNLEGYLVRNLGHLKILENTKKPLVLDHSFNTFNNLTIEYYKNICDRICLSTELSLEEIDTMHKKNTEVVIYGKSNIMTLQQCPIGIYEAKKDNNRFCRKKFNNNEYFFVDRKEKKFLIKTNCNTCYAQIFNCKYTCILDKLHEVSNKLPQFLRLEFLDEDKKTIDKVLDLHTNHINNQPTKKSNYYIDSISSSEMTNAYFYRGVE